VQQPCFGSCGASLGVCRGVIRPGHRVVGMGLGENGDLRADFWPGVNIPLRPFSPICLVVLHDIGGCAMLPYASYVLSLVMLCVFDSYHFIP